VRADRLVSLVLLLQNCGRATARTLAAELEVSVRTIYRDLAALSAAGVPVFTESGQGGGCQLVAGYRFPLRGLRPEEAEALLILGVPGALSDLGLDGALTAAQRQVRVTAGLAGPGGKGAALVHLDMPRWFRSSEPVPCLRSLAQAVRRQRRLVIEYRRADDRPARSREVGPLGITVNAVAPGFIDTSMTEGLEGAQREQIVRRSPFKRFAEVSDVAETVAFLLGDTARNITGTVVTVDAGSTA